MSFLLVLLPVPQLGSDDTLVIRMVDRAPLPGEAIVSVRYGPPQVRIPTRQSTALVWLLRASDTVFVAASIPDSTPRWDDDFVDFQVYFRRVLDSSVVYRGRNGRWQPPKVTRIGVSELNGPGVGGR